MKRRHTDIEEAFVLVNGAKIHYQRAGTGRPLLLLHGLVGSAKNWRQNISFLSQNSTVYAVDLFNMGRRTAFLVWTRVLKPPPIVSLLTWTLSASMRPTSPVTPTEARLP